jgi:GAF domain-containing protein
MPSTSQGQLLADGGASDGAMMLLARALNNAYYLWRVGCDELDVSPAMQALFGSDRGAWTLKHWLDLIHPDDLADYTAARTAWLQGSAEVAAFAYRARAKDETWRWLREQAAVERDASGRVTRQVGVLSDVSESNRREVEHRALIARQAASDEVLRAISASLDDAQPVFELIARHARALCGAGAVLVTEFDGTLMHMRALDGGDAAMMARLADAYPRSPAPDFIGGRAVLTGSLVHLHHVLDEPGLLPFVRAVGEETALGVPLCRAGQVIGAIVLSRSAAGGFDAAEVALVRAFADQAAIALSSAATLATLRERTAELTRRNNEYSEQVAYQAATIDVLKLMSASPDDAQPVFDLITRLACEICDAPSSSVFTLEGQLMHFRSTFFREAFMPAEAVAAYRSRFPMPPDPDAPSGRAILTGQIVHTRDMAAEPNVHASVRALGHRSNLMVPLLRGGAAIGALGVARAEPGGFTDSQVELLRAFAEQAAIAITSAETYRALRERTEALARRNSEYGERIEHQSATIDVLKAMSASPGDPRPVFDLIVRHAVRACNAMSAALFEYDGSLVHSRAAYGGHTEAIAAYHASFPRPPTRDFLVGRVLLDRQTVHIRDVDYEPGLLPSVRAMRGRTSMSMPIFRDEVPIGAISMNAPEPGGFTDSQVELLRTFTEQAAIAITTAETYRALEERTEALARRNGEYGERIEHQSATIDVLKAMSASPGNTQPVFDLIVRRAADLCAAQIASLALYDGETMKLVAHTGLDAADAISYAAQFPRPVGIDSTLGRAIANRAAIQIEDLTTDPLYAMPRRRNASRSTMAQPLLLNGKAVGAILIGRQRPGRFSEGDAALLQTFAEQASIAITAAETYGALQERTSALTRSLAELRALEEVMRAINSSLDLETVLSTIIGRAVELSQSDEGTIYEFDANDQVFRPRAAFGMNAERVALLRDRRIRLGETHLGRSAVLRAAVAIEDVQNDPTMPNAAETLPGIHAVLAVPLLHDDRVEGGLVIRRRRQQAFAPNLVTLMQTFAGQAVLAIENARLFQEADKARIASETTLTDLRRAQHRLVQSEKMASLGQLTAGIAHEIKNPLNFVNNFAELSVDLLNELHNAVAPDKLAVTDTLRAEIDELTATLQGNLKKIAQHGRRADSIVKNMLLHSRSGPGEHRPADVNAMVEEALNLAYHGARAERPGFNITLETRLDPAAGKVDMFPQEITRAMLNLISNGFYAAHRRAAAAGNGFEPTLRLQTLDLGDRVEIRVRDNGTGIDPSLQGRIFEPFFTTKPAGEGTGLGLSLSYDIVVKQHGGQLAVESEVGAFTEFVITLPRKIAPTEGDHA